MRHNCIFIDRCCFPYWGKHCKPIAIQVGIIALEMLLFLQGRDPKAGAGSQRPPVFTGGQQQTTIADSFLYDINIVNLIVFLHLIFSMHKLNYFKAWGILTWLKDAWSWHANLEVIDELYNFSFVSSNCTVETTTSLFFWLNILNCTVIWFMKLI